MAGTGRAPDPNSRRQSGNQAHTWTNLPAAGYDGPIPDWPLADPSDRELFMWTCAWATPHAAAWARLRWEHEVAMYVRVLCMAEAGDMKAITESRLRSLELGLTPTGMLKNRWRVVADEVAERRKTTPRARPKVVADDAVAQA